MEVWEALLLGLIQGLCEFLPVSSSGHLVLLQRWLGVDGDTMLFNITVHVATLLAVFAVMRGDILDLIRQPFSSRSKAVLISFIPTAALALLLKTFAPGWVGGRYLAVGFMLSAALLTFMWAGSRKAAHAGAVKDSDTPDKNNLPQSAAAVAAKECVKCESKPSQRQSGCDKKSSAGSALQSDSGISFKSALFAGIAQGIAVAPGLSRSASTITALTAAGSQKQSAVRFSFLMSIPVILASAAMEALTADFAAVSFLPLAAGFAAAFLSGLLSVRFMLKIFSRSSPLPFVLYLIAMSALSLAF